MNEDPLLDRVLRPNPPMKPRALVAIVGLVSAVNLALAGNFILHGAWPILPFLGTDVALLAWAFHRVQLVARREEHVTLTPSSLRIARRPAGSEALATVLTATGA